MILIDYSQTVIGAFFSEASGTGESDPNLIRHLVLNMLRSYNLKYKNEYGQMIICADGTNTWRKEAFPYYKANRAKNREETKDKIDWSALYDAMNGILKEIQSVNLYPTLKLRGAEADDIIAVLTKQAFKEYGKEKKTLIISSDKDFVQLQKYGNVSQYSPIKKQMLKEKNPNDFLIEHCIRGDIGDGCPNIFSSDDTLVDPTKRQSPVTKKKLEQMMNFIYNKNTSPIPEEWKRNYDRNKKLIDLDQIPKEIEEQIIDQWNEVKDKEVDQKAFMDFLIKNRMKLLLESIHEFF